MKHRLAIALSVLAAIERLPESERGTAVRVLVDDAPADAAQVVRIVKARDLVAPEPFILTEQSEPFSDPWRRKGKRRARRPR